MKISCMKHQHDLVAYVDGELSADRVARVERHMQACSSCSAVVAGLRQVNALPQPPLIEPSADFDRMFWTKLAGVRQAREEHHWLERWRSVAKAFFTRPAGLSLSAGLALGVFVVTLYLLRPPHAALPQQEVMAAADLDLYANLEVIENSEALENFELIQMLDELEQDEQG
jgi:anti-sigma factor RsiW